MRTRDSYVNVLLETASHFHPSNANLQRLLTLEILYSKYLLPAYIAVGGAAFFLALRLLHAINQEDVQLVSDFLGARFSFLVEWARRFLRVEAEKGPCVSHRRNGEG